MSSIKDLRMQLKEEDIKNILAKFGVFVHTDTEGALIFPTVCHNDTGGSPKLYYYKNEKIFKCYTECNAMFDIFDLIMRIHKTRDEEITLRQAIEMTGLENDYQIIDKEILSDLEYLQQLSKVANSIIDEENEIRVLSKSILNNFPFDEIGNKPWIDEGISQEAMDRFTIGYNKYLNAITIPNFDHEGRLIGIRGRFFNEDSKAKYMPIMFKNEILSHPTGRYLYGYYENKNSIKNKGIAVLFEGEKSVLKMETFYPLNNVALSTSGKRITLDHLNALIKLGIREVVIAYDKDYSTPAERKEKIAEYEKISSILTPYFAVSIIVDYENKLNYKDSPADKSKEIFEDLMRYRLKR